MPNAPNASRESKVYVVAQHVLLILFVAIVFSLLELLAIVGSLLQKDVRLVALTGLGWIAAAAVTWALFFARARPRRDVCFDRDSRL